MTITYCDGFDTYTNLNLRWSVGLNANAALNTSIKRTGLASMSITASSTGAPSILRLLGAGAHATITVQLAVFRPAAGVASSMNLQLNSGVGATQQTAFVLLDSGAIEVRRGNRGGTLLGTSSGGSVPVGVWTHVAVKATLADTGGSASAWINGTQVINLSSIDTRNTGTDPAYDAIGFETATNTPLFYVDDLIVINGAGSAPNNTFLGDKQVLARLVTGAGDRTQLTPYGSANNWENVSEPRADGLAYNGSTTNGNADLYAMQDITAGASISAVQTVVYAGKNEVGAKSIAPIVKSGGTEYPQTAVALSTGFLPLLNMFENDPATAAAWTPSGLNAMQLGAEVRA